MSAQVIDIRTQPEWEETGIVPGSKLLTYFDERGRADPAWRALLAAHADWRGRDAPAGDQAGG